MLIENIVQDQAIGKSAPPTTAAGSLNATQHLYVERERGVVLFSAAVANVVGPRYRTTTPPRTAVSKPKPTSSTCITRFCRVSISKTRRSASTSSTAPTRASDRTPPSRSPTPTVGKPSQTRKGRWPSVMPPLKVGRRSGVRDVRVRKLSGDHHLGRRRTLRDALFRGHRRP